MNKIITLLFVVLFLAGCGSGDGVQWVTIEDRYTLSIPSFLNEFDDLNEDASLQYGNGWKEFFVIVIDESKDEMHQVLVDNGLAEDYENNLEGYADLVLGHFISSITNPETTDIRDVRVNGIQAKLTTVKGEVEGIDIYYAVGIYEGKSSYYQVMTWTLAGREDRHKDKMNKILHSLREINQP